MCKGSRPQKRSLGLDLLRIALCAGVILYHYTRIRPSIGPFMVIGFFVMSGFLLGLSFARTEELVPSTFYAHKCRRFLPMLTAAMLFGFFVRILLGQPMPPNGFLSWGNFSLPTFMEWYNVPTWYMGVELILLLAAPFFFFLYRMKNGVLFFLLGSAAFACFLFAHVPYAAKFGDGLYFSPIARCWQFVAGLFAAQIFTGHYSAISSLFTAVRSRCKKASTIATFFLSCLFITAWIALAYLKQDKDCHLWNYTFSFDFLCVIFYSILIPLYYRAHILLTGQSAAFICYLAGLTYPVYLLHSPMHFAANKFLLHFCIPGDLKIALIALPCSLIGAILLTHVEKKIFS